MKQTIALILALILCISCAICISADTAIDMDSAAAENELAVIQALAAEYLADTKLQRESSYAHLGLTQEEVLGMQVGLPFRFQNVKLSGETKDADAFLCPYIYENRIVAILYVGYSEEMKDYTYTFGKGLADDLNTFTATTALNTASGLAFATIENIAFVTDGRSFEILRVNPSYGYEPVSDADIERVCSSVYASAEYKFFLQ